MHKKILFVDDSKSLRLLMKTKFESLDFELICAEDVSEACSILEKWIPTLIITDINLPEIDGFEFIRILKKNDRFNKIPIIVMTGYENNVMSKIKGFKMGVIKYLYKPFRFNNLLNNINETIEESKNYLKVAVKSENQFMFKFKNEKKYFDEVLDMITEIAEKKVFMKEEITELKSFFVNLRDIFLAHFKEHIDSFSLAYVITENKVMFKLLWDKKGIFENKKPEQVFKQLEKYLNDYSLDEQYIIFHKELTSVKEFLNKTFKS